MTYCCIFVNPGFPRGQRQRKPRRFTPIAQCHGQNVGCQRENKPQQTSLFVEIPSIQSRLKIYNVRLTNFLIFVRSHLGVVMRRFDGHFPRFIFALFQRPEVSGFLWNSSKIFSENHVSLHITFDRKLRFFALNISESALKVFYFSQGFKWNVPDQNQEESGEAKLQVL